LTFTENIKISVKNCHPEFKQEAAERFDGVLCLGKCLMEAEKKGKKETYGKKETCRKMVTDMKKEKDLTEAHNLLRD
jgi:hypothetical protein